MRWTNLWCCLRDDYRNPRATSMCAARARSQVSQTHHPHSMWIRHVLKITINEASSSAWMHTCARIHFKSFGTFVRFSLLLFLIIILRYCVHVVVPLRVLVHVCVYFSFMTIFKKKPQKEKIKYKLYDCILLQNRISELKNRSTHHIVKQQGVVIINLIEQRAFIL